MRYWIGVFIVVSEVALAGEVSMQEGLRLKEAQQLPAASAVFREMVAHDPLDIAATEQLALVESWQRHYDLSIDEWRRVIELQPDRPGAKASLARVLYWKGERAAALRILDEQLAANPADSDALVLRGDVLLADGRAGDARRTYLQAQSQRGQSTELSRKIASAAEPPHWHLDLGGAYDHFNNARGNEDAQYAQIGYALSSKAGIYLHYDRLHEFGATDQDILGGGYWRVAPQLLLVAEAGGSIDKPDFRPDTQFAVGAEWLGSRTVQPLLGYRYLRYNLTTNLGTAGAAVGGKGNVSTVTPGVRLIAPRYGNLELRYGFTRNVDGSNTGVEQLRINIDPIDSFTPYIAAAHGKEALPPQPPATFTVLSAGGVYDFTASMSARLDLAYEHRPRFYDHQTVALGLSYKF